VCLNHLKWYNISMRKNPQNWQLFQSYDVMVK
jgi:hypothetical protein